MIQPQDVNRLEFVEVSALGRPDRTIVYVAYGPALPYTSFRITEVLPNSFEAAGGGLPRFYYKGREFRTQRSAESAAFLDYCAALNVAHNEARMILQRIAAALKDPATILSPSPEKELLP